MIGSHRANAHQTWWPTSLKQALLVICIILVSHKVDSAAFNESCDNSVACDSGAFLVCTENVCLCKPGTQLVEPSLCKAPGLLENCSTVCDVSLTCLDGFCNCTTDQYYSTGTGNCVAKPSYEDTCNETIPCAATLTCDGSKCNCTIDEYWDGNQCQPRASYEDTCNGTIPCAATLTCDGSKCTCTTDKYWDRIQCQPRPSYNDTCSEEICAATLTCLDSKCKCTTDQYWDGSKCQTRLSYDDTCSEEICAATLTCLDSKCKCTTDQYWDGNKCQTRLEHEAECNMQYENVCKDTFVCAQNSTKNVSMCICSIEKYFNGSLCVERVDFEMECNVGDKNACKDTLICASNSSTTMTSCVCSNEDFFNGSLCVKRLDFEVECNVDDKNACKDTLICASNSLTTVTSCVCSNEDFFNGSLCVERLDFEVECNVDDKNACKDTLICASNSSTTMTSCVCSNEDFFNGSLCVERLDFEMECNEGDNNACKDTLICASNNSTTMTSCVCSNEDFFNGSLCVKRRNHGVACNNIANECGETLTSCKPDKDGAERCLCDDAFFWAQASCRPASNFQVSFISAEAGTTSVDLTWQANDYGLPVSYGITTQPAEGNPSTATRTGGRVTGLTPGREYLLNITSTVHFPKFYEDGVASTTYTIWMKPSRPVGDGEEIKTGDNQYNFTFSGSIGDVDYYSVNISGMQRLTEGTSISNLDLTPGVTYTYTITAVNRNGDSSEPRTGSFTVGAERPGPVREFSVKNKTDTSLTIQWKTPADPNGELLGYLITSSEKDNGRSCQEISIICSSCADSWPSRSTNPNCVRKPAVQMELSILNNASYNFEIKITELKAYVSYTVVVQAVNKAYYGDTDSIDVLTNIAVPQIQSMAIQKLGTETTAGVRITWTPEAKTGPTIYTVILYEETGINSGSYAIFKEESLTGYDRTTLDVNDLLAYWNYRVSVQAYTEAGLSTAVEDEVRTISNAPGEVTNFDVELDTEDAQKITIRFNCPIETERKGVLTHYVVKKSWMNLGSGRVEMKRVTHNNSCNFAIENFLSNLIVGTEYLFQVQVINSRYNGSFNSGEKVTTEPKAPKLRLTYNSGVALISPAPSAEPTEEYITVTMCASCLLDNSQGEIVSAGLLVCVNKDNKQCTETSAIPTEENPSYLRNAVTWSKAEEQDFSIPYLATPQNWHATVEANTKFSVGSDQSCKSTSVNAYCNGPLPSGAEVRITVVACTTARCSFIKAASVYRTKASSSDSSPVAVIIGVIIGVLVVAVVVLAIVYYMRRRRQIPKANPVRNADPEPNVRRERPVNVRRFGEALARYHKDANLLFQDDFEDIKKLTDKKNNTEAARREENRGKNKYANMQLTAAEAEREENRVKNRYVNILPYDHSRVKLSVQSDEPETMDFINANYIPGFNSVREYIATQGPMYSTIPDFWRMMWEQNSKIIVMLSDLQELGKRKVDLYWPENLNEPINYGNVVVEMTNFSQLQKSTIRNFKISWGENEPRRVTHFFLAGWMDFSANLKFSDVLEFAKLVRQEATPANTGPIVVHCSAGVGRTGTFIALDYFMQHLDRHGLDGDIDIFSNVMRMRLNRPCMVQAETQYIFIYDALNEVIKQKLKEEEEHLYDNNPCAKNSEYANMGNLPDEESIYVNTNGQPKSDTHVYDNQGFELESEVEDKKSLKEEKTPTTVL